MTERFLDTNVLLYLLAGDEMKADQAERVLSSGGVISVQVLNEFASVACRKLWMPMTEVREVLAVVRSLCRVVPLGVETHELGLQFAERYKLSIYDSMILSAAQLAGCDVVLSEDMQDGQTFDGTLTVRNPFA